MCVSPRVSEPHLPSPLSSSRAVSPYSTRTPSTVRKRERGKHTEPHDLGIFGMLILATGKLRHWAWSLGWRRSRALSLSHGSMKSRMWEAQPGSLPSPAKVKGLKASKKAKRLEYSLVASSCPAWKSPGVSPWNCQESRKREEGGECFFLRPEG